MYMYRCQYRTHTCTAVNTEHIRVLLSRYKTYAYYFVLQILMPAFGILVFWDVMVVGQFEGNLPTSETTRLWKPQIL